MAKMPASCLLALVVIFWSSMGFSCICEPDSWGDKYKSSAHVFVGRVEGMIRNGDYARYQFRSLSKFKGNEVGEYVTVDSVWQSAACGYPFKIGKVYLVYADLINGRFESGLCSGVVEYGSDAWETELSRLVGVSQIDFAYSEKRTDQSCARPKSHKDALRKADEVFDGWILAACLVGEKFEYQVEVQTKWKSRFDFGDIVTVESDGLHSIEDQILVFGSVQDGRVLSSYCGEPEDLSSSDVEKRASSWEEFDDLSVGRSHVRGDRVVSSLWVCGSLKFDKETHRMGGGSLCCYGF